MNKLATLLALVLCCMVHVPAMAQDFATVDWIQMPNPKGKWKNVDASTEAVWVKESGEEVSLKKDMPLPEDALIRTAMVRVGVMVDKNEIEIHEGSEARIQAQGVMQMLGNLYFKVRGAFKVNYGTVEAVVEGTVFEVHGPDPKWVGVSKGQVRVKTPAGEVVLTKNQRVSVNEDGSLGEVKDFGPCPDCGERHGPEFE